MGIAVYLISNQHMMRICCSQERNIYRQATMSASINILATSLQTEGDRLTGGLTSYILLHDTPPSIVGRGGVLTASLHTTCIVTELTAFLQDLFLNRGFSNFDHGVILPHEDCLAVSTFVPQPIPGNIAICHCPLPASD